MRKPPALPMPCTGGGCTTIMNASWIGASVPNSAPCNPAAESFGSRARFSNLSSTTNIAPAFGALENVAPEKPTIVIACATPGTLRARLGRAAHHLVGTLERGARRQLRGDDQEAAILLRNEAGRRALKQEKSAGENAGIEQSSSPRRCARRDWQASRSPARRRAKPRLNRPKKPWNGRDHQAGL